MNLSRIVCASPGGDASRAVLASAIALAVQEHADLRVIDAAEIPLADLVGRGASGPALIVPAESRHGCAAWPFRNILCPVDFSPGSVLACAFALRLAQRSGGVLTLLHVLDDRPGTSDDGRTMTPEHRLLRIAEARARLGMAITEETLAGCQVGLRIDCRAPDAGILNEARLLDAEVIVLGLAATPAPRGDSSREELPRRDATRADSRGAEPCAAADRIGHVGRIGGGDSLAGRVLARAGRPVLLLRATAGTPGWDAEYDVPGGRHGSLGPGDRLPHDRLVFSDIGL